MKEDALKLYYIVGDGYTEFPLKHCSGDKYNSYNTVAEAKEACNLDSGCQSVYDQGCDKTTNDIYLCPIGITYMASSSSCIYEKGKNFFATNKAVSLTNIHVVIK